jgi:hypothetical protein
VLCVQPKPDCAQRKSLKFSRAAFDEDLGISRRAIPDEAPGAIEVQDIDVIRLEGSHECRP